MLRAFDTSLSSQSIDYTNDELIAYIIQSEWDDRQKQKDRTSDQNRSL